MSDIDLMAWQMNQLRAAFAYQQDQEQENEHSQQ